jgi:hypothetical protein
MGIVSDRSIKEITGKVSYGDELRALRKLQKDYPNAPFIFMSSRKSPLASTLSRELWSRRETWHTCRPRFTPTCSAMLAATIRREKKRISILSREVYILQNRDQSRKLHFSITLFLQFLFLQYSENYENYLYVIYSLFKI